jgi:hypothetical protein
MYKNSVLKVDPVLYASWRVGKEKEIAVKLGPFCGQWKEHIKQ